MGFYWDRTRWEGVGVLVAPEECMGGWGAIVTDFCLVRTEQTQSQALQFEVKLKWLFG
jgi:hypothetical protein